MTGEHHAATLKSHLTLTKEIRIDEERMRCFYSDDSTYKPGFYLELIP